MNKGPWTLHEGMTIMTVRNAEGDAIFCDLKNVTGVREDAQLISCAPCLYEAATDLLDFLSGTAENGYDPVAADEHIEKLRQALKKGRTE